MSDRDSDAHQSDDVFREALQRWESEHASKVPGFAAVSRRIAASPSPLGRPRWTIAGSLRLAVSLAWAQVRIVPWLVIPVALVTAAMAVLAAWFFGLRQDASAAVTGFSSLMLIGITVTVTMALSTAASDAVSLATPLGPQVVVLARVAIVLVIDAAAGFIASAIVAAWGITDGFAAVLAGWMVPLAAIAGAVTFIAIWITPWAGVVIGVVLMPLVGPRSASAMDVGLGAVAGVLREAITPVGVVASGLVLLAIAVASARRALTVSARVI